MRASLIAVLLTVAASATTTEVRAQEQEQEQQAEWLFVQTAESVTLKDGVLTLHGISPATLFFSDRPERISAHGLTTEFVTFWQRVGDDSFGDDPRSSRKMSRKTSCSH